MRLNVPLLGVKKKRTDMNKPVVQAPCPRCGTLHTRSEYKPHIEKGRTVLGPHDVKCSCGLELRWRVPLFKQTESGYVLGLLRFDETPFFEDTK
jgi:hypothetical protein